MEKLKITMGQVPMGTIVAFALHKSNVPAGWLPCDGSLIPQQYQALATALNSKNTPNLCGQVIIGDGKSPVSGNTYALGQTGGEEQHTLIVGEMPSHTHNVAGYNFRECGNNSCDSGSDISAPDCGWWNSGKQTTSIGGNTPHNNMQPYMALNYIIFAGN